MEETDGLAETGKPENSDDESEFIEVANKRLKLSHDEQRLMKNMHIDRPLLRAGGLSLLKQADDDEDFSSETEKMMKVVPGLKGAMLYARRRIIEKATAREMARSAAISTTLPPFQFVNEKGEDTVDAFIAKQKRTKRSRTRRCGRESRGAPHPRPSATTRLRPRSFRICKSTRTSKLYMDLPIFIHKHRRQGRVSRRRLDE